MTWPAAGIEPDPFFFEEWRRRSTFVTKSGRGNEFIDFPWDLQRRTCV
jgi:hypothetical protein